MNFQNSQKLPSSSHNTSRSYHIRIKEGVSGQFQKRKNPIKINIIFNLKYTISPTDSILSYVIRVLKFLKENQKVNTFKQHRLRKFTVYNLFQIK